MAALAALALALAGCGGTRQDVRAPSANFPVQVTAASFPGSQRLSEHTHMVLSVRNTGTKSIPNLTVTVCNVTCTYPAPAGQGTSVAAFSQCAGGPTPAACKRAQRLGQGNLSRPVWIVDQPPGGCGYSCQQGGEGGNATATSNSWQYPAPLPPGATATFDWHVTAVAPGTFTVAWVIAADQSGKAKAVLASGSGPCGTTPCGSFPVRISQIPAQSYVNSKGQVVQSH